MRTLLWLVTLMPKSQVLNAAIAAAIARAPDWLRSDLLSKDARTRLAAEEAMAAMIRAAIEPVVDRD